MLRAKTLLVLGAGASFEVGLPLGEKLLEQIAELVAYRFEFGNPVKGDRTIFGALKEALNEDRELEKLDEYLESTIQLVASSSQAKSIDTVIDTLEDQRVALVGKLGIARVILDAEKRSNCFSTPEGKPNQIDLKRFEKTWYSKLATILYDGRRKSDVENVFTNLEIINFNYDRCLETYFTHSLAEFYGLTLPEAQNITQTLVAHRPYGSLGKLPWYGGEGPHIPFGECGPRQVALAARQIRTFTERIEEDEAVQAMRAAVTGADRIIFLGFGFHRQNIDLISAVAPSHCEVLATGFKLTLDTSEVIEEELKGALGIDDGAIISRVNLRPYDCMRFFDEFSRRLTAASN